MKCKYDTTKMLELTEDGEEWRFYNNEERFENFRITKRDTITFRN